MVKETKLYDLLNVSPTAGESEIRKAYYKLAKLHHPDKFHDVSSEEKEKAEEKFKEIKFAYEVLNDPSKRETYDRFGLEGLKDGMGGTEFEDIFSHLFGGFGGGGGGFEGGNPFFPFDLFGGGRGRQQKRRTQNMAYPLKVTLEDLYKGLKKTIDFERSVLCTGCQGSGGKSGAAASCKTCSGRGFTIQYRQLGPGMVQQVQGVCRDCSGEGEVINEKDRCKQCNGKKTIKQKKKLEVNVEKGMSDGQKITFRGESNQEPGVDTGDLIVILQQTEHDVFTRNQDDLFITHVINITEALCGFRIVVKHLDSRTLVLNHPAGEILAPGSIRAIPNEGMPMLKYPTEKGNLYIKFDVKFPDNNSLTEEAISVCD